MSQSGLSSLTAILLTLTAVLIIARLKPRVAFRWLKLPAPMTLAILALLTSIAGFSAFQANLDPQLASPAPALQAAAASGPDAADMEDPARARAIDQLRDYANTIAEKKQAIAAFGSDTPAQSTATALPDVETMLERLVQRLKSHPDDVKGWTTLAWAYANTGRTSDAIGAYEKAIALDPGNGELQAALAAARGNAAGTAPPTNAPAAAASPPAAN